MFHWIKYWSAIVIAWCCGSFLITAAEADLLKTVQAPPGWKVTLFAAPPEVSYPACLGTSPRGDLFVGIDENGSLDAKGGRGRVVRCTDTNGDGRADQFVTFAEMDSPRGLWFEDDTLYVMHPPLLESFHDTDGDGKSDRRLTLVRGLGFDLKFRGADHTVNGMRMGIDGFLYIAVGDYGATNAVGRDGTAIQLQGGGVVRVRPDGTGLSIVSRGQRNIYDVAVSPELDLFTRDNTNDGDGWDVRLSHVVPGGHYGYPSLFKKFGAEIIQPLADYGGGSPCGALFMDEPGFPEGFGRALYTVEWGRGGVLRHPLTAQGAGWKAGQEKFIDASRPTDMDVDASGCLYLSSWHGATFNYAGPNAGFVVRVTPPGWKAGPLVDWRKAMDADVVQQLASPSACTRLYAQRELRRRRTSAPRGTADAIKVLMGDQQFLPVQVAAFFAWKEWAGSDQPGTILAVANEHPRLREFVLRAIGDDDKLLKTFRADRFVTFLGDADPRVRLQAVTLLGRRGDVAVADKMLPLTADADPLVAHLAVHSLVMLGAADVCLAAFDSSGNAALQPGAARVLQALHETNVVDGLIARLGTAPDEGMRRILLKTLARLFNREADWDGKWWGTRPDTSGPYYKPVSWNSSARIATVLQDALARADAGTTRFLVIELQKNRVEFPELVPTVLKLAREDAQFRPVAIEMFGGRAIMPEEAVPLVAEVARNPGESPALRATAVRALLKTGNPAALDAAIFALTVEEKSPAELKNVWEECARDNRHARNLARFLQLAENGSENRRILGYAVLAQLANARPTPAEARSAASASIERAWSKPESSVPLLKAITRLRLEGHATQVRGLLADRNSAVAGAARSAATALKLDQAGDSQEPLIEKLTYPDVFAEVTREPGNLRAGRELFTRAGCVACHTTRPDEAPKGPFLGGIATRYSRADLCESILKPSAKIAQGFETQWFKTGDDDEIEGFVTREAGDDLDVRNLAGIVTTVMKKEIRDRGKRDTSMMPAGLLDKFTARDLASLLAFLESLKAD